MGQGVTSGENETRGMGENDLEQKRMKLNQRGQIRREGVRSVSDRTNPDYENSMLQRRVDELLSLPARQRERYLAGVPEWELKKLRAIILKQEKSPKTAQPPRE